MHSLVADRAAGTIHYGSVLLLNGIPPEAWEYVLGHKSALDHVLDGIRARLKPYRDATLREHFPPPPVTDQEMADWALHLAQVATVSVRTREIVHRLAASSPLNPANHPPGWRGPKSPPAAPKPPPLPPTHLQLSLFSPFT